MKSVPVWIQNWIGHKINRFMKQFNRLIFSFFIRLYNFVKTDKNAVGILQAKKFILKAKSIFCQPAGCNG